MDKLTEILRQEKETPAAQEAALKLARLGYITQMSDLCALIRQMLEEQLSTELIHAEDVMERVDEPGSLGVYDAPGLRVHFGEGRSMSVLPVGRSYAGVRGKAALVFEGFKRHGDGSIDLVAVQDGEWVFPRKRAKPATPFDKVGLHEILIAKLQGEHPAMKD